MKGDELDATTAASMPCTVSEFFSRKPATADTTGGNRVNQGQVSAGVGVDPQRTVGHRSSEVLDSEQAAVIGAWL